MPLPTRGLEQDTAGVAAAAASRDGDGREGPTPQLKFDPAALADTTEPRRLWRAGPHGTALPSLRHAIARGKQLVVLTGDPGVGKTIGINALSQQLANDGLTLARVATPVLDADDLRAAVGLAVGLSAAATRDDIVAAAGRKGRIAIIVDDAHAVGDAGLAEVGALLHAIPGSAAVLAGPDVLAARLATPATGLLSTLVPVTRRLRPLAEVETELFVRHLLEAAGASPDAIPPDVVRHIWRTSGGVPRVILHLCRHTLESAGPPDRAQLRRWTEEVDEQPAQRDDEPEMPGIVVLPSQPAARFRRPWKVALIGSGLVIGAALGVVAAGPVVRHLKASSAARTPTPPASVQVPRPPASLAVPPPSAAPEAPRAPEPPPPVAPEAARVPESPPADPARTQGAVRDQQASPTIPSTSARIRSASPAAPASAPARPRPAANGRASAASKPPSASARDTGAARDESAAPASTAARGDRRTDESDPTAVIDWLLKDSSR
jgi:type II secretory pathway predicted ATPase ExeA